MSDLINFFSDVPIVFRTSVLLGGIMFFWVLEGLIPLYSFKYKKTKHAITNLFFTLSTAVIGFGLAFILLESTVFVTQNKIGIILYIKS